MNAPILIQGNTRFGTYPVIIHMQYWSTNIAKVRTAITRMQTYCKAYDPKCFLFHTRQMQKMCIYRCRKRISIIILIMNKM